ncbi:MAG: flagellar biosynthesis anti-sigma factor FlgM [Deferribacterales bacterium]
MRIEQQATQAGLNKLNDTAEKKKVSSGSSASESTSASDSVSLSDSAKELAGVKSSLQSTPDVRTDLVAELKSKIENGQYNVSGQQIAEKIVQTAIDGLF